MKKVIKLIPYAEKFLENEALYINLGQRLFNGLKNELLIKSF